MIKEVFTSTLSINLVTQWALKAWLSLNKSYGKKMELAKYYKVILMQTKVALEAGVDFSSEALVTLKYCERRTKDPTPTERPVWRDPLIKI